MKTAKIVIGAILLIVAIYMATLMPINDPLAKYLGGGIIAIVGLGLILTSLKKEEKTPAPAESTETTPTETPQETPSAPAESTETTPTDNPPAQENPPAPPQNPPA